MEDDYDGLEDDFTYSEYTIDDSLDSLTRLERYHQAEFSLQRLILVKELYDTATESGFKESVNRLLPILTNFVSDSEPAVRQVFADQLYPLACFFIENSEDETGYNELLNTFIPYSFELIIDKNVEVAQAATEALVKIANLLKKEHIQPQLLSVVVNLAHDDRVEEYRIAAAKLFNELATVFGEKLCRDIVVNEIVVLSEDSSLLVRKTVAQNFGKICKIIGIDNTVNKIFPVYLALAKDEIWGVRKACAESLPYIAECSTPEVRQQLVENFKAFAEDVSRWVKIESFKQLGPFIASFKPGEKISHELIKHFTNMSHQSGEQNEGDLVEYCAYNFPAVVLTLGKERWPLLEAAYTSLMKDVNWKVRKSLSYSLHELAAVIGQEASERVLTQAFELFLRDVDEVKLGATSVISKFLALLSPKTRAKYLTTLCNIPEENENWRVRQEVGKQLGDIAQLYSAQQVRTPMLKLAFALFNDAFAEVRNAAITSCGLILKKLAGDKEGEKEVIQFFQNMYKSRHYVFRQLFVKACHYLARDVDPKLFETEFLTLVANAVNDKVPNVRIALAQLIGGWMSQLDYWKEHPKIMEIRNILKQDKDRDVKYFATFVLINQDGNASPAEQDNDSYSEPRRLSNATPIITSPSMTSLKQ